MTAENKKVDIKLYPKNGNPIIQDSISPLKFCEYIPPNQTPKFVTKKNMTAPDSAPNILNKILFAKYLAMKPIIITLPQVKKTEL